MSVIQFPDRRGTRKLIRVSSKDDLIHQAVIVATEHGWTDHDIAHMVIQMQNGDTQDAMDMLESDFADVVRVQWV